MVGESYSVSGALAVAGALGTLSEDVIPPTVNYSEPDPDIDLNVVAGTALKTRVDNVLVTNFGPSSGNHGLILRKFRE